MPATRNVDPEVGAARASLAVAVRDGRDEEAAKYRKELDKAKKRAAIKRAVAHIELTDEQREHVRALLAGA